MGRKSENILNDILATAKDISGKINKREPTHEEVENIYNLFNELCDLYMDAEEKTRTDIRGYVRSLRERAIYVVSGLLYSYIVKASEHIKTADDQAWLWRGSAAASIEEGLLDYKDLLVSLSHLFIAGERAGLDVKSFFQRTAEISDKTVSRQEQSTYTLLVSFHQSDFLKMMREKRV
jgi:hypothetical protein